MAERTSAVVNGSWRVGAFCAVSHPVASDGVHSATGKRLAEPRGSLLSSPVKNSARARPAPPRRLSPSESAEKIRSISSVHGRKTPRTGAQAAAHGVFHRAVKREIQERNRGFSVLERVKGVLVLDPDFSVEDSTLSHTDKVRRVIVGRRYAGRIDAMYGVSHGRPGA